MQTAGFISGIAGVLAGMAVMAWLMTVAGVVTGIVSLLGLGAMLAARPWPRVGGLLFVVVGLVCFGAGTWLASVPAAFFVTAGLLLLANRIANTEPAVAL